MNPYQVEFRYYTNSETFSVKTFKSLEEMHQYLLYLPQDLKVDTEIFVHINDEKMLMEDYLYTLMKAE